MTERIAEILSMEDACTLSGVPEEILLMAIQNGFAQPVSGKPPYAFSSREVAVWSDWPNIGRLIESRLKRNEFNEYLGRFIEPGEFQAKRSYLLPFSDLWLVGDGGCARNAEGRVLSGHYYTAPCNRWAWDFVIIHPADYRKCHPGMTDEELDRLRVRRGQEENRPNYEKSQPFPWERDQGVEPPAKKFPARDFFCHGKNIVAPADGVVVPPRGPAGAERFINTVEEARKAGDDRPYVLYIDHGSNEYSVLGHILARSIVVEPGQKVKQGELICQAGGEFLIPHLHWGIVNHWHPLFAQSLPVLIKECRVNCMGDDTIAKEVWLERGMLVG